MLSYDAVRAFSVVKIYWGALAAAALAFLIRIDLAAEVLRKGQLLEKGWTMRFVTQVLTGEEMLFFLPVVCAMPYAAGFTEEWRSGQVKFALARIGRREYLRSKILAAAVSGGCILLATAMVMIAAASLLFLPLEAGAGTDFREYLPLLLRYFCFGALGALIGLWISTAVNNRYMAWMSPFMAEYLLIILCERYIPRCRVLHPREWLAPASGWPLDGWSACLWMLGLALFAACNFWRAAERRLSRV